MKISHVQRVALLLIFVAALMSAVGGVVYFLFNLSFWVAVGVAVVSLVGGVFLTRSFLKTASPEALPGTKKPTLPIVLILVAFALAAACLILAYRAGTTEAINTPWPFVAKLFWVSLSALAAACLVVFLRARSGLADFFAAAVLLSVAVSVAALVYKLGYGFDPFIHRAAEWFIVQHGQILPKTPYYAGQYAFVSVFSILTRLPVRAIDIWLLPALSTLGIAVALSLAGAYAKKSGRFLAAAILLTPFSLFINTTPFGLACLYALLAFVFAKTRTANRWSTAVVWLFSAASVVTHPIVGVPAALFALLLSVKNPVTRLVLAVGGVFAVPLMFWVQGAGLAWTPKNIFNLTLPFPMPLTRFHSLGDLIYISGAAIMILAVGGTIFAIIKNVRENSTYGLAALSTAIGALVTVSVIDFTYLPTEEQAGYPARLLAVAMLMLIPPAAGAIAAWSERLTRRTVYSLIGAACFVFLFASNVYLSYPRSDAYVLGKGWSVSASDLLAAEAIAADAGDEPYIVLASEPVSAAALERFGFFKYFKTSAGDVFAYPLPLGGELYKYYLKMIYEDTSERTIGAAMEFAGVRRAYFVMNPYWTGFARISAAARASADAEVVTPGKDTIFRYERK